MQHPGTDAKAQNPQPQWVDPVSTAFLHRLGARINASEERSLEVAGVVLCTVLWEAPPGALEAIQEALPREISRLLSRCREIRGNTVALTTPQNIVTAISRRMNIDYLEAERYTQGVVEVTREFVGESNAREVSQRMGYES
jgi:hypothetical protein